MIKIVRTFVEPDEWNKIRFTYYSVTDKFIQLKVYRLEDDPDDLVIYKLLHFKPNTVIGKDWFFRTKSETVADFSGMLGRTTKSIKLPSRNAPAKFNLLPKNTYFYKGRKQRHKLNKHVAFEITNREGEVELSFEDWRKLRFEIDELFMLQGIIP